MNFIKLKLYELKQNQGFFRYFKNTSWLLIEKIVRITVGFFVGVWVIRYLGPERFGKLSYAQSFVAIFATIATLGLDNIVVRELVKNKNSEGELLGTSFLLKIIGSFFVLIFLTIVVTIISNDSYTNTLIFVIASATIFQSFNVIDLYFQSIVISRYVVYGNLISLGISSIIKILLILNQAHLEAFAWIILFDSIVLALGFIYFFFKKSIIDFQSLKFNKVMALELLKDSWPLIFSGIVVSIYMKIDQVMIKEMLDDQSVGQYAAAVRLSEAWYFIPVVISSSLFPAIVNSKKYNQKIYESRIQNLYSLLIWISVIIAIGMSFLSESVINLLYGNKYFATPGILMIHIWSGIFVFLGVASGKWLLSENLQKITMINTTIGAIINILLNYFLIKKIGPIGAAWSTLFSYSVAAYFGLFLWTKTRKNFISISKSILNFNVFNYKTNF